MILTEKQKTILFYALEAVQKTLYFDKEDECIYSSENNFYLQVDEFNNITSNLDALNELIDKTLDDLCK